jgi:medium-chain acyl-[acyl-carrier-protein] hydrolase
MNNTLQQTKNDWFYRRGPSPKAQLRLFCFPYAGGGASIYHTWSNELPQQIDVCPIQLPGRENRLSAQPFSRLAPLIEALVPVIGQWTDLPFALFGHSMGSLICFELARVLQTRGLPLPAHLLVSGRHAPHIPSHQGLRHDLSEPAFVDQLRRLHGTPEEVLNHPELLQLLLPVLRADFALVESYVCAPSDPLNCPISAYGGLQDVDAAYHDMQAWQQWTTQSFKLRLMPGNHFFIHSSRSMLLQAVVQDLTPYL